jgi:hypothetical protein
MSSGKKCQSGLLAGMPQLKNDSFSGKKGVQGNLKD